MGGLPGGHPRESAIVSCAHANPTGYLFCASCGATLDPVRCRCGFVVALGDAFCGRCGTAAVAIVAGNGEPRTATDHRLDLEQLAQRAAQEKQFLESSDKARVTQDDIRKLLAVRRKKF